MKEYINYRETGTHTIDKNLRTLKDLCHGAAPYALNFCQNFGEFSN